MRKRVIVVAAGVAVLMASHARAQGTLPLGGRVFASVNVLVQPGEQTFERSGSFDLFDEQGSFRSRQVVEGDTLLDIGGGVRLGQKQNFGVGVSYTRFTNVTTAEASGSIPHPLFFDRSRAFTATVGDLLHKEQAVHVSAMLFVPFVENVDFTFFAGPSFFIDVDQEFPQVPTSANNTITGLDYTDNDSTVTVTRVGEVRGSESAVGFNIGGDVTYSITRNIGVGATLRYTRASVDFDLGSGNTIEMKAGNAQIGAGVRFRF